MDDQASDKAEDKTAEEVNDENKSEVNDVDKAKPESVEAKADPAPVPVEKAKSPVLRSKTELSIIDLGFAVLFLVVLSLLVANSYIAYLGRSYNERICAESIALAGKAANDGLDTPHVQYAAFGSFEHCAEPGIFIGQPQIVAFKDEITLAKDNDPALRVITVSLTTKTLVPASFLVVDQSSLDPDDQPFRYITFKNTCQYRLTNPKISGTKVRTPDGKIITVPGKSGAPAAKTGAPTPDTDKKPASKPAAKPNP